jgi:dihydroorotase
MQYAFNGDARQMRCAATLRLRSTGDLQHDRSRSRRGLQVGAPGDVTMLELVEGPVEFVDTRNNRRTGKVSLRPVQTVSGGIAFGRPYSAPFSVR